MQYQVDEARTPEGTLHDIERVLGEDGRADPARDPGLSQPHLRKLYEAMVRTRMVDERMTALQRQGRIGFHIGSYGEEAAIIASAAALRERDWIFPCYRELGALLMRGFPLERYLANMFGNADDQAKGRQMPDHYSARAYRFGSISSPIGTQISQAVGFAKAAEANREDVVVGVYFGEGATSSHDFHSGLNFAGVMKAKVVFLCRNNRWAISLPSERQTASSGFAAKASAYGMRGVRCDGNDPLAVYRTVHEATLRAARGQGPTLVEMVTYRLGGHSTSDDPKAYRLHDEVERWNEVDPIARMRAHLRVRGLWSERDEGTLRAHIEADLSAAIRGAEACARPALETLFDDVYGTRPPHLEEQARLCSAGPRPAKGH